MPDSAVLGFDGSSSLLYRLSPGTTESISLNFKTLRNSGTLLHAAGQNQLSLSLGLEKGRILLLLQRVAGKRSCKDVGWPVKNASLLRWTFEFPASSVYDLSINVFGEWFSSSASSATMTLYII